VSVRAMRARLLSIGVLLPLLLLLLGAQPSEPKRKRDHAQRGAADTKKGAPGALVDAAFELHKAGRFVESRAAYRRAISALRRAGAGENAQLLSLCLHNLAYICAHELNDLGEARKQFAEATMVRPTYFEAYHNLGQALQAGGLLADAIEQFQVEASIRPDLAPPLLAMASCYKELGDVEAAAAQALRATALDPSSTSAFNGAGWFLHLAGRSRDADALLKKGIRLHPSDAAMHFHRGKALSDLGNARLAAKVLKAAVRLDPSNPEAHLLLGMAYFEMGDLGGASGQERAWGKSAAALEQALLGLDGNNAMVALNHLAHAHWQMGRHELALGLVAHGLARDDSFCDLHVRRLQLQVRSRAKISMEKMRKWLPTFAQPPCRQASPTSPSSPRDGRAYTA
jgi:tetratricopeptide (TPR) repeat protein